LLLRNISSVEIEPTTNQIVLVTKGLNLSDDDTDSSRSKGEQMCALGVTAFPYVADENGSVEAMIDERSGIVVGMRDPRVGKLYGALISGDTALHDTHKNQATRLLMKGESRQAAIIVDKENGKQMIFSIDGSAKKVQISANGAIFQIDDQGNVQLTNKNGFGLIIDSSGVWVKGSCVKLGANPSMPLAQIMLPPQNVLAAPGPTTPMPLGTGSSVIITP